MGKKTEHKPTTAFEILEANSHAERYLLKKLQKIKKITDRFPHDAPVIRTIKEYLEDIPDG